MTTTDLAADMVAMGFEEVPPTNRIAKRLGNRDFQRNGTLIRFWGYSDAMEWVHIVYKPIPEDFVDHVMGQTMYEVVDHIGRGLATLCVFLAKGGAR